KKKKNLKGKSSGNFVNEGVLARYLEEIDKIKLLTREEEKFLAERSFFGDKEARSKLIQANLRFVVNTAKKYQKRGLPLIDLINEGNIGLICAADKFDYRKGYHFISYAIWWIRQAILKALSEKSKLIRLPLNRANQLIKIERYKKEISQQNDYEDVNITKIAEALNYKVEDVSNITNAAKDYIPIDVPINGAEDSERKLYETIEDDNYKSPEQVVIEESLKKAIEQSLSTLPRKEREILSLRFGLNGKEPLSLKEIGEAFDLTKERIRQIEKKAIKRLRHPSRSIALKMFLTS
ncbi:MAG: sigma-70 family RNA polymerase sigma factor, partial [Spirochaetota bacterium]